MKRKLLYRAPLVVLIVVSAVAILGWAVQHLWNWLIPGIVGWHAINYWQAVGILLLCKILFGGFRGRGGVNWRHRIGERWEKMSPEERERFMKVARDRCGYRDFQPEEQKI